MSRVLEVSNTDRLEELCIDDERLLEWYDHSADRRVCDETSNVLPDIEDMDKEGSVMSSSLSSSSSSSSLP